MISTSGLPMWHIPACTHAHTYANMSIHCRQTQHRKWKFMKGCRKSGGDVLDNRLEANCIWVHCVWESTVTQLISFFSLLCVLSVNKTVLYLKAILILGFCSNSPHTFLKFWLRHLLFGRCEAEVEDCPKQRVIRERVEGSGSHLPGLSSALFMVALQKMR